MGWRRRVGKCLLMYLRRQRDAPRVEEPRREREPDRAERERVQLGAEKQRDVRAPERRLARREDPLPVGQCIAHRSDGFFEIRHHNGPSRPACDVGDSGAEIRFVSKVDVPVVGKCQCQGSHGYVHFFNACSVAELSDQV